MSLFLEKHITGQKSKSNHFFHTLIPDMPTEAVRSLLNTLN